MPKLSAPRAPQPSALRKSRWFPLVWALPLAAVLLVLGVLGAQWFLRSPSGQDFIAAYPGASAVPEGTPEGFPWWMKWQHALNFFLMVLIIRAGWLLRVQQRPEAYWTRRNTGRFRTKKPPTKMSLYLWLHLLMDALWVPNGILFGVLLFATGSWRRIVPTSWDVFPNALSAGLQYLSLNFPVNEPFLNYNALQVLAYFTTVFVAAPIAAVTGIRMSPVWRPEWKISKIYPLELARALHLPTMFYFVVFIVTHVALVLVTDLRLNLNAMYSWHDEPDPTSWWGLVVFMGVLVIVVTGWVAARPLFMQSVASMSGKVTSR